MLEPTLSVAAVARRLGIAPSTLRTWDRRYGIGPSGHTTGRHRRYGPADLALLELMQRALLRGAAPAEAAEYALRTRTERGVVDHVPVEVPTQEGAVDPDAFEREIESAISVAVASATQPDVDVFGYTPVRAGGRVLRLPGGSPRARGLGRAALAMDAIGVQQLLTDSIAELGVVEVWDTVIRPVLLATAGRWQHSGECVEVEHLVHECALAALITATPLVTVPLNPRPVLIACVPHEQHSLPLYALRAALAVRDIGTQLLGAALPTAALAAAVRRTAPVAVVLWSQLARYAEPEVFDAVPRTRQQVRLFACGPGWEGLDLPATVESLEELAASADRIEAIVLGS